MDLGLAILYGSALAIIGIAVITVGLWLKARVEEQFLSEELGAAAHAAYKARTPMLVPRMWRRARTEAASLGARFYRPAASLARAAESMPRRL